jgi:competence protein ComEC
MKLPAIAIAAFFAVGIAVGLIPLVAHRAGSHTFVALLFAASVTSLLFGIVLAYFERIMASGVASLLCWGLLGMTGACVAQQPRRAEAILSRVDAGTIDLSTPLRFYGQLRDEPQKLPWGVGYDIALSGVDYEGAFVPATGGLRLSYATHPDGAALAKLHTGDSVSVLTQAKQPQVFRDEGAFDRRAYLAQQGIDLVATLRAPELLQVVQSGRPGFAGWTSRARRALGDEIDAMWSTQQREAGVLRAMLLGDRSFVEREEAIDFQKTGAFHVLVVAGLHVGAFAVALFWLGRRLRLQRVWTAGLTLLMLLAYASVVEQRAPVLRAGLMAALVVMGGFFFRRLELLNSAAVAALVLLVARPLALRDASFQLSFLAIGCIAGLAIPWLEGAVQPYARALRGWRDVTRDAAHEPRAAQLRIDLRSLARVVETRLPARISTMPGFLGVGVLGLTFRVWELLVLTLVLQIGMLPLLAGEFHRITPSAPLANFAAVPLTALIVPGGFVTLVAGGLFPSLRGFLAMPLSWLTQDCCMLSHGARIFSCLVTAYRGRRGGSR